LYVIPLLLPRNSSIHIQICSPHWSFLNLLWLFVSVEFVFNIIKKTSVFILCFSNLYPSFWQTKYHFELQLYTSECPKYFSGYNPKCVYKNLFWYVFPLTSQHIISPLLLQFLGLQHVLF
jgi:hypothetical protein